MATTATIQLIQSIHSVTGLAHEILEVATTVCAQHDAQSEVDARDVDILYGLLTHAISSCLPDIQSAGAPRAPESNSPRILGALAHVAIDHVVHARSKSETARKLFTYIVAIPGIDANSMDALRASIARAKMYIAKDTIVLARNCALIESDMCQLAVSAERSARRATDAGAHSEPDQYSPENFDSALESAIDSCSANILSNYPDDTTVDRAAFARLFKKLMFEVECDTTFNLIRTAHELRALVGNDPKLNEYVTIAAARVCESRVCDA